MPNYELGKIYEIVCLTTGKRYIGSTARPLLCMRLTQHISEYKHPNKARTTAREIMEGGNYKMNLLEACPCKTKDELNAREYDWINKLECVNKQRKVSDVKSMLFKTIIILK